MKISLRQPTNDHSARTSDHCPLPAESGTLLGVGQIFLSNAVLLKIGRGSHSWGSLILGGGLCKLFETNLGVGCCWHWGMKQGKWWHVEHGTTGHSCGGKQKNGYNSRQSLMDGGCFSLPFFTYSGNTMRRKNAKT